MLLAAVNVAVCAVIYLLTIVTTRDLVKRKGGSLQLPPEDIHKEESLAKD